MKRVVPELEEILRTNKAGVKILLFDIETAPLEVYVWQLHKQYINPCNVIKDWSVLSWSAKWLCDDKIYSGVVNITEARRREDKRIMKSLWKLVDSADIIIAHNAKRFDVKKINTRFLKNQMRPPSPFQVIDTLIEARKHFAFSSNKLDYLNKELGLTRKISTDFNLWKRCVTGDKSALKEMEKYNKQDIVALEDLYFNLRPWIKSHPNVATYVESDKEICPTCGSHNIEKAGYYNTPTGKYQAFRCECGAIGRRRHTMITRDKRNVLLTSAAR